MAYADIRIEAPEAFLTKKASADELYRMGLIYSEGMDVAVDLVARTNGSTSPRRAVIVKQSSAARKWPR